MSSSSLTGTQVVRSVGTFAAQLIEVIGHAGTHVSALRRPAVRLVFHKQVLFTGIQALLPVAVAGLVVGIALMTQMRLLLGSGVDLNVKMLRVVVLREFAPLLTAFIVLGRSGSAMAAEISGMKVRGELRTLYLLGISPGEYLLMPRVIGCALAVPALTVVFQFVAAVVGPLVASVFVKVELTPFYMELFTGIRLLDVVLSLMKTTMLGLSIAGVACATGCFVPPEPTWIPQAAELSVLRGFILILGVDLVFAIIHILLS
ncbi:MlaE family ABC transporter permease [Haloferula sp. A504]|uniref:MlaE family ABC transporter permease n=1 Tax=Haloferula sp. A504 TaxID=3373601 RepID=UPI0031C4369E|nr:ABC transporter permease [Verrucomicrobiaceae bacterium E54]